MKRLLFWVVLIPAVIIGFLIYRSGGPGPALEDVASYLPEEISQAIETATRAPAPSDDRFVFKRLHIDTSGELPRACLVFSQALDETGQTRYEDYVRFQSNASAALQINEEQMCLAGLAFATQYRVTLRKGMPSASGQELVYEENIPIELADRPSMVQFGQGLILPRESEAGIPLTTVNVETVDLKVFRVSDRLLTQLETGLIDQKSLYSYEKWEMENEQGALVWQGQMAVSSARNQTQKTVFNIRDAIKEWKPGAYLVLASDAAEKDKVRRQGYFYSPTAAQWVIDSNIGLTTLQGQEGLHVFARSLDSASPISGIEIALVARNNEELGRVRTNSQGLARFSDALLRGDGGARPVAVMAYGRNDDFNFLDLRRPSFDLTDRGVDGRQTPGPVDAYLYTERGIYRPGERVHVVSMLRDQQVRTLSQTPLTLSIRRPDGIEVKRLVLSKQLSGASHADFALSATAPRGRWQAVAYIDPKVAPIGRVSFDVQDFVPQKLEVALNNDDAYWSSEQFITVDVDSRFLYGAPAADLGGEAELKVMIDPNPFPQHKGYRFGRLKEQFRDSVTTIDLPLTDKEGRSVVEAEIPRLGKTTLPLRARLRVAVYEPGGRTTQNEIYKPLRSQEIMLGIRPDFKGARVREETPAGFEIIAVDKEGVTVARDNVRYRLVRENTHYQWYQTGNRWQYERIVRDEPVSDGVLSLEADKPAQLSETLSWGQYRLIVSDASTPASSSVRFHVGWGGAVVGGRPDRVTVASEKEAYMPGDMARIDIRPPVGGKALLVVAGSRVYETRELDIPEEGLQVDIPVSDEWGSGAYAMVTVYKPLSAEQERAPIRSIGLTWLAVDRSDRTLSVTMDAPERITPRQKITIPVQVEGLNPGEQAHLTLAAVDQGILQLTKFKSPSPAEHYFAKHRLGVAIRDDYGRLITGVEGDVGALSVGGDALGGQGLSVVPTRTVALFSGLVALDDQGRAEIPFTIPDFVGELRLMAVAMSADKVGMGERPLTIRDDVVADMTLPRFLAPGDQSLATLLVHNVDGLAGDYSVRVDVTGATSTSGNATVWEQTVSLAADERRLLNLAVNGNAPGIGTIALTLDGPDDFRIKRNWPIEVRPAQLYQSQENIALLASGDSFALSAADLAQYYPDTASLTASVSGSRGYDVPGLLGWLDRYPYGCLEQTTSRAFPLMVYNDLALLSGVDTDDALKARVQGAIDRVLDMQNGSGSFGMWGPGSYDASEWLSVFALDFILNADARDYVVPRDSVERGIAWLRNIAGQSYRDKSVRAYAFYVLANQGAINPGDLRYFVDRDLDEINNPLSIAHVAAALYTIGDKSRGRLAFDRALRFALNPDIKDYQDLPYGSYLRDLSGVTAMAASVDETQILPALFEEAEKQDHRQQYTTTQEKAWMLLAAYELSQNRGRLEVDVQGAKGKSISDALYLNPSINELQSGVKIRNEGERDIWRTVSVAGVPLAPLPAAAEGMRLTRSYWTLEGTPARLSDVKQNERFIVLISGEMESETRREMIALDMLPAGWEIEGLLESSDRSYTWLPALTSTKMVEARDDRFVAAFDVVGRWRPRRDRNQERVLDLPKFHLAYVVRAVTPGSYVLPAVHVEDMYAPKVFARSEAGRLTVAAQNR